MAKAAKAGAKKPAAGKKSLTKSQFVAHLAEKIIAQASKEKEEQVAAH